MTSIIRNILISTQNEAEETRFKSEESCRKRYGEEASTTWFDSNQKINQRPTHHQKTPKDCVLYQVSQAPHYAEETDIANTLTNDGTNAPSLALQVVSCRDRHNASTGPCSPHIVEALTIALEPASDGAPCPTKSPDTIHVESNFEASLVAASNPFDALDHR